MGRKQLKRFEISEELFDLILVRQKSHITTVDNFSNYTTGYFGKNKIIYDGVNTLIIRLSLLYYYASYLKNKQELLQFKKIKYSQNEWYQVIITKNVSLLKENITESYNGVQCFNNLYKIIRKYYTFEEFDRICREHSSERDSEKSQYHYKKLKRFTILRFDNTYAYDVNGAHTDAVIELFPKAKDELVKFYNSRLVSPERKAYVKSCFNFFVGCLTKDARRDDIPLENKGILRKDDNGDPVRIYYPKTYNWIIQRTNTILQNAINYCNGRLVYANTDGFIVQNPQNLLDASMNLGEFKLEFQGTTYTYQDQNYECHQYGDKIKGSILYSVRDKVDLANGLVPKYNKVKVNGVFVAENIYQEVRNVETYEKSSFE